MRRTGKPSRRLSVNCSFRTTVDHKRRPGRTAHGPQVTVLTGFRIGGAAGFEPGMEVLQHAIPPHIRRTQAIPPSTPCRTGGELNRRKCPSLRVVLLVPEEGVEPSRPEGHGILSYQTGLRHSLRIPNKLRFPERFPPKRPTSITRFTTLSFEMGTISGTGTTSGDGGLDGPESFAGWPDSGS